MTVVLVLVSVERAGFGFRGLALFIGRGAMGVGKACLLSCSHGPGFLSLVLSARINSFRIQG